MEAREWSFALMISGAHGMDHLLKRVFPPLVPIWAVTFGFPLWKLGVLLGARSFGSALGQAPMGHLSDRYDRRVMLPAGIAVMGVAFVAFAALPTLSILEFEFAVAGTTLSGQFVGMLLAMVAAGIGSSTLHPTGYPLISQNVSAERKGKVLGMWGSARAFGDGTAPALVGVALLVASWQPIIAAFGVLGLLYAGYLFVVLGGYETRPADHVAADDGDVAVDDGDVAADEGDRMTDDGDSSERSSVLAGDRRLYLYPMAVVLVAFVLQLMATAGANVFLPQFITSEYGYAFSLAGYTITPESTASFYYSALLLTAGVVQLGTGSLVDRFDHRKVLIGFLVGGASVLLVLATVSFSPVWLFAVLLLLGSTLWGLNPARDAIVSDIAPADREGRTFGYLWTGGLLLSSVSPALIGYVGDVASLRQAFLVLTGLVVLSVVPIALLLSERVYLEGPSHEGVGAD